VTLRARLLLVLVGVVAAGLLISDVVVYSQLRSYLVAQVTPQLRAASFQVEREVFSINGFRFAVPPGVPTPPGGGFPVTGGGGYTRPTGTLPVIVRGGHGPTAGRSVHYPSGTVVGELVGPHGGVEGKRVSFFLGGKAPSAPVLPTPLPAVGSDGEAIFTASSAGADAVTYQVLVRPLHERGLSLVVAIPLTGVNQTTGHLALVMLLVSLIVLIGLGLLAWWIVRRGLRPLEDMAATAGKIAGGDLGERVSPADDRTEVGRLGLALNTMLGEIEEAFAARAASEGRLRRFLADASHELRTPLTSIRGYAEIFDLGARDRPEDLATSMHRIREEADRMKVLVDDLLLLARLDQERPPDLHPMDLVPVAARSAAAAEAASPGHAVTVEAPEQAMVSGDVGRLRQVLDNLLTNAIRHSPEGAPVTVRVATAGPDMLVEVADEGPGVPPEVADRIFEPFFRADFSRARTAGGAGLGLAIVAAIVREHGGTVGVRGGEGGGAVFWVRIPALPTASPQEVERVDSAEVV
jgi:two-component system OmpR family sensor kinase